MKETARNPLEAVNDCGCCQGTTARTPVRLDNRAGLAEIAYRGGTHAQFKESMLARLSSADRSALARLRTRDEDDFSIALLDAWATLADVLTFYQERLANESYLRTARQRRSILELARLIGYQLRPGVAASAYLAFTLEQPPPVAAPGTVGLAPSSVAQVPDRTYIEPGVKVQGVPGPEEKPQTFETVERIEARPEWNAIRPRLALPQAIRRDMSEIWVQGADLNLKTGDVLVIATNLSAALKRIELVEIDREVQRTRLRLATLALDATDHRANREAGVWVLRVKAAPFGHNAPQRTKVVPDESGEGRVVEYGPWSLEGENSDVLSLDAVYDQIPLHSLVVISHPSQQAVFEVNEVQTRSEARYGITGRVTVLTLNGVWLDEDWSELSDLRGIVVYTQSEKLTPAEVPWGLPIQGKGIDLPKGNYGLRPGQAIVVSGQPIAKADEVAPDDEEPTSEIAIIESVIPTKLNNKEFDNVVLESELRHAYVRDTVTINANVARATHGESVGEVLGSGDGSRSGQHFSLRQPPLTHVAADTPSGSRSTLQVRVNGLLWQEVPTLFGRGPDERIYVTRLGDEGVTTVQFGDGVNGARPPSGQDNVRAEYRKGSGVQGLVKARQLCLLMSRPLGVREAVNPEAAEGAADAESRDEARRNAPLDVLTLDRVVSLRDFEDFARTFAGVAKALATWSWQGDQRAVTLTVAGPAGRDGSHPVGQTVLRNLSAALRKQGDPLVRCRVVPYRPAYFRIAARIKVHPDHPAEKVLASVEQTLRERFGFDAREFGQPVARSEVTAVVQQVSGIEAADLDEFRRSDAGTDQVVITEELIAAIRNSPSVVAMGLRDVPLCDAKHTPVTVDRELLEASLRAFGVEGVELEILLSEAVGRPSRLTAQLPTVDADGRLLGAELLTLDNGPLELGLMT